MAGRLHSTRALQAAAEIVKLNPQASRSNAASSFAAVSNQKLLLHECAMQNASCSSAARSWMLAGGGASSAAAPLGAFGAQQEQGAKLVGRLTLPQGGGGGGGGQAHVGRRELLQLAQLVSL